MSRTMRLARATAVLTASVVSLLTAAGSAGAVAVSPGQIAAGRLAGQLAAVTNTLGPGGTLAPSQSIVSADSHYRLDMQGDGNLVEYVGSRALWATGTGGHPGAYAVMQGSDGNLVVYTSGNSPLWGSGTNGNPGASLQLNDDASLDITSGSGSTLWSNGVTNTSLGPGETLRANQFITSGDGHYRLVMGDDGNLVEYAGSRPLWATGTSGHPGAYTVMQTDGNLVVYDSSNNPLWASHTNGHSGAYLHIQDDTDVVIKDGAGNGLWANNAVDSTLGSGETLAPGWFIRSPNTQFKLIMQSTDGNLVLYNGSSLVWATGTTGNAGAHVSMQSSDGNLVVYTGSGQPLWGSGTVGHSGAFLQVRNDGTVVVQDSAGDIFWTSNQARSTLNPYSYPWPAVNTYIPDGHGYYEGECTSFASWAIRTDGMPHTKSPDWLGNAMDWKGAYVDTVPHVGDIAQWDPNVNGAGSLGHVAYVAAVNADGSITVYEYNWGNFHRLNIRTIPGGAPSRYLHF